MPQNIIRSQRVRDPLLRVFPHAAFTTDRNTLTFCMTTAQHADFSAIACTYKKTWGMCGLPTGVPQGIYQSKDVSGQQARMG